MRCVVRSKVGPWNCSSIIFSRTFYDLKSFKGTAKEDEDDQPVVETKSIVRDKNNASRRKIRDIDKAKSFAKVSFCLVICLIGFRLLAVNSTKDNLLKKVPSLPG